MFSNLTIAFIGSGNMGEAMIHGLIKKGMVEPEQVIAADPRIEHLQVLHERYGMRYTTDNLDAATKADILVLSVKPQVLDEVLHEVRSGARTKRCIKPNVKDAKQRHYSLLLSVH